MNQPSQNQRRTPMSQHCTCTSFSPKCRGQILEISARLGRCFRFRLHCFSSKRALLLANIVQRNKHLQTIWMCTGLRASCDMRHTSIVLNSAAGALLPNRSAAIASLDSAFAEQQLRLAAHYCANSVVMRNYFARTSIRLLTLSFRSSPSMVGP